MFSGPLALPRLTSLLLMLILAGLVTFWGLLLLAPRPAIAPPPMAAENAGQLNLAPAAHLFGVVLTSDGTTPEAPPADIKVAGVLAGARGVALLALDDKPALPYAAGARIDRNTRLVKVDVDAVTIERGGREIRIPSPERTSIDILNSNAPTDPTDVLTGITFSGKRDESSTLPMPPSAPIPVPAATPTPNFQPQLSGDAAAQAQAQGWQTAPAQNGGMNAQQQQQQQGLGQPGQVQQPGQQPQNGFQQPGMPPQQGFNPGGMVAPAPGDPGMPNGFGAVPGNQ